MADCGLTGMNESQFRLMINTMFDNAKNLGLDSVICQVRPNSDALYKSSYFPYCRTLTGTEGVDPGYDPLKIMVSQAHSKGLKIHAWVNPYRISTTSTSLSKLAANNPAKIYETDGDPSNDRYVLKATDSAGNTGLYYNPAIPEVRQLIINGIKEICQNYDVDGIHIDDYFYPTTAASFDDIEYAKYKVTAGSNAVSLANWRKENVNILVKDIYSAVKSFGNIEFGVSPAANIERCQNELYSDVEKWMSTKGYIDYIMPQIYYGYEYPTARFRYTALLNQWMSLPRHSSVKIHIGLANYKIDTKDQGSNEWKTDTDIIARQTTDAYNKKADGVVLFSYCSVFGSSSNQKTQTDNFYKIFKTLN
ncbi:MAG: FenI protein [Ruminococcaceae bacterium]|nr:FenI protein [Oscillospiraceae bacterium]